MGLCQAFGFFLILYSQPKRKGLGERREKQPSQAPVLSLVGDNSAGHGVGSKDNRRASSAADFGGLNHVS